MLAFYALTRLFVCRTRRDLLRAPRRIRSLSAAYSAVLANRREIGWIGTQSQIPVTAGIITPLHAVSAPLSSLLFVFSFFVSFHFLVVKFCCSYLSLSSRPGSPVILTLGNAALGRPLLYSPCPPR